ncbi:MgtC/SapB family protein [Thermoactinomyces mirandus]|uniref:MgtC/SapB family protein n=1 Tax=Thermoactinomyces mirandus TaxID=2756294 RepID=A0A7W2ARI3_9BACL|nr:MgtC/SapB family protein [Thermoactinomyces mirandus]MBA4603004.1 MgtC/SapB family protein [Thermoactinomyces mirandus]
MAESVWTASYLEVTFRLFMAAMLGGLVGWERERNNHPAGFRTHILVSLGSALIMLISIYGFAEYMDEINVRFDPSRLSAQVVSGIGFLGAGTIMRHRASVTGLTTAASLWVVSGIGLAVGAGFMFGALLSTILVLVSLELLNRLESVWIKKKHLYIFHIIVADEPGKLGELASLIARFGGKIRKVNMEEQEEEEGEKTLEISFTVRLPDQIFIPHLIEEMRLLNGVRSVSSD